MRYMATAKTPKTEDRAAELSAVNARAADAGTAAVRKSNGPDRAAGLADVTATDTASSS